MRLSTRWIVFGLAAWLAAAPAAAAQQGPDLERLRSQISPEAFARLTAALDGAERTGLPTQPLVFKALEGVAKRVPEDRILLVIEQLEANLGNAKAMLEQAGVASPSPSAITGVATALERGAPPAAVPPTVQASPGGDPTVAMNTIAVLIGLEVPAQDALEMVLTVLENGGHARDVAALPVALGRLRERGLSARDAAQELKQALKAGRGVPGLAVPPVGTPSGTPGAQGRPPVPTRGRPDSPPGRPPTPW